VARSLFIKAGLGPPERSHTLGHSHKSASGVEHHLRIVSADVDGEVTASLRRIELVAGEYRKVDKGQGALVGQAKSVGASPTEKAWAEADIDGQARRAESGGLLGIGPISLMTTYSRCSSPLRC
jgi:hypothetical protein